jgi:hypothetical protein
LKGAPKPRFALVATMQLGVVALTVERTSEKGGGYRG